jgi:mRNA interferase MazF
MKKGDIVLVRYPFTDLSSEKLRPALVLLPEDQEGDLLLAFITSTVIRKSPFDIQLPKDKTGLHKDSMLRLRKIMDVHKSLILGKIGNVSAEQWMAIESALRKMFDL